MGSADPPGKKDEKLKSENMQERAVSYMFVLYVVAVGATRVRIRALGLALWTGGSASAIMDIGLYSISVRVGV